MHPLVFVGITVATFLWLTASTGRAQQEEVAKAGRPTYEQYCAACHGREGKGDGGAMNLLTVKPADLTQLSKKNNGTFPFWHVYAVINGREEAKGHGTSDMPFWGTEFRAEAGTNPAAQTQVRGRILELVYYLESIQAK
jgi:mono/diheme cytochrome c family protein